MSAVSAALSVSREQRDLDLVEKLLGLLLGVADAEVHLELVPEAGLLDFAGGVGDVVGFVRFERTDFVECERHGS